MNSVRPHLNRVRKFFFEAVETPDHERDLFVASRCFDLPPDERAELLALLKAHDTAGEFLLDPTSPELTRTAPSPLGLSPNIPTEVGPYRLIRELGEGGFGSVYLAEQEKPLRRQVALKLIKPGMDTVRVISRFDTERQALALMEHPSIARVFDAGETNAGRPWFAMEYVGGPTMTAYSRQQQLELAQKLALFLSVCQGVHHAHQKGIIHRDLKPANILIADQGGQPVPTVIDFGIAKALTGPLNELAQTAENLRAVGTPTYMSPEQAGGVGDVDTRTDIYALGVLLYEMLTGVPPFDPAELKTKPFFEQLRILREDSPPLASRRLLNAPLADVEPMTASQRDRLGRELRQDLDWIIVRAMEKDPAARYATVDALVSDVLRYLAHEPVLAGPPTKRYRLKKFGARHKRGLVMAAGFLVVVGIGATVATLGWLQARDERAGRLQQKELADAQIALADERKQLLELAEATAEHRGKVIGAAENAFRDMFLPREFETEEDIESNLARMNATVRRLDLGKLELPDELAAPLRSVLGFSYHHYTKHELAEAQAREAVKAYRRMGPTVQRRLAASLTTHAAALSSLNRDAEVEPLFVEAVAIYLQTDANSPRAKAPVAMMNHAVSLLYRGEEVRARTAFAAALERFREAPNADPEDEPQMLHSFSVGLRNTGHAEAADDYAERSRQAYKLLVPH